jgi:hypothetical protein
MSDIRQKFEEWYAINFLTHIPNYDKPSYFVKFGIGYTSPHIDGAWHGYQSNTLALESRVKELTEALEYLKEHRLWVNSHAKAVIEESLSTTTPTPNMDKRDAEVIERCADLAQEMYLYSGVDISDAIRQLKHCKE